MASEVKSDKLSPSTGTALQIGDASDTITIPTGATFTVTDGIGVASGGTGLASFTAGDILYATGTTTLAKLAKGTAEQVLAMNSGATAPDWGSVDLTVLPTITVAKGGTNLSSFTAGDVLYATGSTTLAKLAKGSADDVLTMNSGATAPEWAAAAGGGKLVQYVAMTTKDTNWTQSTGSSFIAVNDGSTDMALTITPTATNSKILLTMNIGVFSPHNTSYNWGATFKVYREIAGGASAFIQEGTQNGSTLVGSWRSGTVTGDCYTGANMSTTVIDTTYNSTAAITYTLYFHGHATGTYTAMFGYANSGGTTTAGGQYGTGISNFDAMEIGA